MPLHSQASSITRLAVQASMRPFIDVGSQTVSLEYMANQSESFEKDLYLNIPIAKQMGVRAKEISSERVVLTAPLAPNKNHNNTGFGGSVYSIAVLSCWSLVSTTVRNSGLNSGYIVIQDSEMSYLLPVEGEFLADAVWPSNKSRNAFLATLRKKGIARARLISEVKNGESVRARLSARFVAQLQQPG